MFGSLHLLGLLELLIIDIAFPGPLDPPCRVIYDLLRQDIHQLRLVLPLQRRPFLRPALARANLGTIPGDLSGPGPVFFPCRHLLPVVCVRRERPSRMFERLLGLQNTHLVAAQPALFEALLKAFLSRFGPFGLLVDLLQTGHDVQKSHSLLRTALLAAFGALGQGEWGQRVLVGTLD